MLVTDVLDKHNGETIHCWLNSWLQQQPVVQDNALFSWVGVIMYITSEEQEPGLGWTGGWSESIIDYYMLLVNGDYWSSKCYYGFIKCCSW